jgi:hypothetical protein
MTFPSSDSEEPFLTSADGHKVIAGMKVWILDPPTIEEKTVKEICSAKKLLYDTPCSHGYIGARYSVVYLDKSKAEEELRAWEDT